jgi:hypothetical protein
MMSYRSELGGLASALAVLGVLERSVRLNIRSVKCVSDNQSAVRACKRKPTESIFHKTESDYDLLATITNLQENGVMGSTSSTHGSEDMPTHWTERRKEKKGQT